MYIHGARRACRRIWQVTNSWESFWSLIVSSKIIRVYNDASVRCCRLEISIVIRDIMMLSRNRFYMRTVMSIFVDTSTCSSYLSIVDGRDAFDFNTLASAAGGVDS